MGFATETYGSEVLNHRVLRLKVHVSMLISAFLKAGSAILKFEENSVKFARKISN